MPIVEDIKNSYPILRPPGNSLSLMRTFLAGKGFLLYAVTATVLAAFVHRDILFNPYSFGRHWDWSFYPLSDFYVNYMNLFFYSFKPNYLGYYDILSMNLAELALKSFIFLLFKGFQHASISIVNVSIIYKTTVFVLMPLISSIGIWALSSVILTRLKNNNKPLFFGITLMANLFYTFSLLIIFDLHGGALNRQLSSVFFPFIWAITYRYFMNQNVRYMDRRLLTLTLFFAVFDISNIFYFGAVLTFIILAKKQDIRIKLAHIFQLSTLTILINFYWIHAFFIGKQLQLSGILHGRRPNYLEIFPYSATFSDIIFATKTPHDQILRIFAAHPFTYIPGLIIFLTLFTGLLYKNNIRKYASTYVVLLVIFFFTVALAGGTNSIGDVHKFLYDMPFFSFIGGALRYMPNVLIFEILLFLFSVRVISQEKQLRKSRLNWLIYVPVVLWIVFLASRGSIVSLVYDSMVGPKGINHEAGALYDYDERNYALARTDRLEYNILPVPSWYSPVYVNNIYPTTSQGSVIDNFYFGRGMLYTNTTPLFSSEYFKNAVAVPNPLFYSFSNVGRIMYGPDVSQISVTEYNFSPGWAVQTLPQLQKELTRAKRENGLFTIPERFFYPHVYAPTRLEVSAHPAKNIFKYISPETAKNQIVGIVLQGQNNSNLSAEFTAKNYQTPVLEYKKINPTKYKIVAHNAKGTFPLIISTDFYNGWKLYAKVLNRLSGKDADRLLLQTGSYKVLNGNTRSQADKDQLAQYIKSGWITTLGDGRTKSFTHYDYHDLRETPRNTEYYTIDYISQKMKGSIQNENLQNTGSPKYQIPDKRHLTVNGYANGWIIDPREVCRAVNDCDTTSKDGVTIEFTAEFYPQRYFLFGLTVTTITLAAVTIMILRTRKYEA